MRHKNHFGIVLISCLLIGVLFSCHAEGRPAPDTEMSVESVIAQSDSDSGSVTAMTTTSSAEGASPAPFVPFTLKHKVTDLTGYIPVLDEIRYYCEMCYINCYVQNDTLYTYIREPEPHIVPFTRDGVCAEGDSISVPSVKGLVPLYAQHLHNDRFCLIYEQEDPDHKEGEPKTELMMAITTSDGTIIDEILCQSEVMHHMLEDVIPYYPDRNDIRNYGFLVSEEPDGRVMMIMNHEQIDRYFRYDNTTQTIDCIEMDPKNDMGYELRHAVYLGDKRYFFSSDLDTQIGEVVYENAQAMQDAKRVNYYKLWDIETDTVHEKKLLIPDADMCTRLLYGMDGMLYYFNRDAIWQYKGNMPPVKIVDFKECGIRLNESLIANTTIWIFDDRHIIISCADGVFKDQKLSFYHIETEHIPEVNTRQRLRIDFYGLKGFNIHNWLDAAVVSFNAQHPEYDVDLNVINRKDFSTQDDFRKEIEESILHGQHPDLIITEDLSLTEYYNKNAFLNLRDRYADALLPCVVDSELWGEALYTVPLTTRIDTFLCTSTVTDDFLTWNDFFDISDALAEGEVLTSDPSITRSIYNNGIMDFFDKATKTASYDTEEFCDMIRYVSEMGQNVDENVGLLATSPTLDFGYTNPTLPARLRDGGIKFLTVPLWNTKEILAMSLMFGDADINWCGLPSRIGGGANINNRGKAYILADTDARDAAEAFVSYLLSDDMQIMTDAQLENLPVTVSAMRKSLEQERFFYYADFLYDEIGNPNAITPAGIERIEEAGGVRTKYKVIPLLPLYATPKRVDPNAVFGESHEIYNEVTGTYVSFEYVETEIKQSYIDDFMDFLAHCHMKAGTDDTVLQIVTEELSYWENGVTPIEEAAKKIQSRVQIYLNE